ncbi:MAG: hypothetical protein J5835_02800 [Bacteroidales bacterium]|nr:hypothetical protein [Bacteroidales bacterium]
MNRPVIIFLSAACLLLQACMQELDTFRETSPDHALVTITATLESPTKTILTSSGKVRWTEGDKIKIFNSSHPSGVVYTLLQSSAGTMFGQFQGEEISGNGPFYAVYPADAASSLSGTSVSVTLPSSQVAQEGSFGNGASISMAKSSHINDLVFKNVLGAISFTLDNKMDRIVLSSADDGALCGSGRVSMSGDTPSLTLNSNLSCQVELDCKGKKGPYYIMLPVGALSTGFKVQFRGADGNIMTSSSAKSNTIARSTVIHMPAVAYSPVCKASFYDATAYGYYTGVQTDGGTFTPAAVFDETVGQYSYMVSSSARTVRVQNLQEGFFASFTTPLSLSEGTSYSVSSERYIGGRKSADNLKYVLVKQTKSAAWFVDMAGSGTGFIQMMED